jgi:hypothetical protein
MTATPIINCPFDVIKLINLCKPMNERIPDNYEQFSPKYLLNNGKFSKRGKNNYLDDISGYISYLNRSSDISQFSQPEITHINVPMIKNDVDVCKFDKKIIRELYNPKINELRDNIDKTNKKLETDITEMNASKFQFLKHDICDDKQSIIPTTKCNKIINSNIRLLVNEVKSKTKEIREDIKDIRVELKDTIGDRINLAGEIGENRKELMDEYDNYKKTVLYQVKNGCGITADNTNLQEHVKKNPLIIELDDKLDEYNNTITDINNIEKVQQSIIKDKIASLRHMIKTQDLNNLEKSVVNMTIKSTRSDSLRNLRSTRKLNKPIVDNINRQIHIVNNTRNKIYSSIRKSIKKQIRVDKRNIAGDIRKTKRLRKVIQRQTGVVDEIKDDYVNSLVSKYKIKINDGLNDLNNEMMNIKHACEEIKLKKSEDKLKNDQKLKQLKIIAEHKKSQLMDEKSQEKEKIAREKELEKEKIALEIAHKMERIALEKEHKQTITQTKKQMPPVKKRLVIRKTLKNIL